MSVDSDSPVNRFTTLVVNIEKLNLHVVSITVGNSKPVCCQHMPNEQWQKKKKKKMALTGKNQVSPKSRHGKNHSLMWRWNWKSYFSSLSWLHCITLPIILRLLYLSVGVQNWATQISTWIGRCARILKDQICTKRCVQQQTLKMLFWNSNYLRLDFHNLIIGQ